MKSKTLFLMFLYFVLSFTININAQNDIVTIFRSIQNPHYSSDVLIHDFSDFITLLEHGKKTNQPLAYADRTLRLYLRLLKETPCLNGFGLTTLIEKLPTLMEYYFSSSSKESAGHKSTMLDADRFDNFKARVNNMLYNKFLANYADFKKDPDIFFDNLSNDILGRFEEEINIEECRQLLIRFLEIAINKMVWSPTHESDIWPSIKKASCNLSKLTEINVIEDIDDLDDLCWSMIYRLGSFIHLFGTKLSVSFYEVIEEEINIVPSSTSTTIPLFQLEEQQDWLPSKIAYLKKVIRTGKAKMLACNSGIISS